MVRLIRISSPFCYFIYSKNYYKNRVIMKYALLTPCLMDVNLNESFYSDREL